jgi:hypothetical protein
MRRVAATAATAILLLAGGCGLNSYEKRMDSTLERMRYEARLNKNLTPAPTKPKWEELSVYIRPPKNLAQAKEFLLTAPEPGKFDLEASFIEEGKQQLHVLVRRKMPKGAAKKKAPSPADTADRTDFNRDVLSVLSTSYSPPEELTSAKFKATTEKKNEYKKATFSVNEKGVEVYLFKKEPYEVALIFEYPTTERTAVSSKISLCLESFRVGESAKAQFAGGASEEEGAAGPAPAF